MSEPSAQLDAALEDERNPLPHLERAVGEGAELAALVDRYAPRRDVGLHRALSFLVARAASRGPDRRGLARLTWRLLDTLPDEDETTRVNVLGAIVLLAGYGELLPAGAPAPEPVIALLLDALGGTTELQATALPVLGRLHREGHLATLAPAVRDELRARVDALREHPDELVQLELPSASAFMADSR